MAEYTTGDLPPGAVTHDVVSGETSPVTVTFDLVLRFVLLPGESPS